MVEKLNTNGTDFADIRELKTEELENVSGGAEPTCEVKVTFVGSAPVISVQCR
jgi:lactobin A/cerein 7B family class IIb bacteriocin